MATALNMTMRLKQDSAAQAERAGIKANFPPHIQGAIDKALRDSEIGNEPLHHKTGIDDEDSHRASRSHASLGVKPCSLSLREAATNSQATCQSSTPSVVAAIRSRAICCFRRSDLSQA